MRTEPTDAAYAAAGRLISAALRDLAEQDALSSALLSEGDAA